MKDERGNECAWIFNEFVFVYKSLNQVRECQDQICVL